MSTANAANAPVRLRLRAVTQRFGSTLALDAVDLEVGAGEIHALIGENGAGKSTLMRILAGALQPGEGEIWIDGQRLSLGSPAAARAAGVAMIFQELSLAPHLSVAENVLLGVEPRLGPWLDRRELRRRAGEQLARLGRTRIDLDQRVARLSPADRQLVEIARALALRTRVLVLDEPTSSLDGHDVERLFSVLRSLSREGVTLIFISHVLEEVRALCERFTVLRDGRIAATGAVPTTSDASLVAAMVGREVSELYPRTPAEPGEVVARVAGLAGARLPRDATLEIRRGEVLGLAGLIGAGRTEFLRALFGLDRVVRGDMRVLALSGPRRPHERWRQGVGMASEDRTREGLGLARSVAENLCLPRLSALSRFGVLRPAAIEREARGWIERLHIKCASARQPVGRLSGGNQQKVALARLLCADVDLLLLDEPTRGVDVGAKAEIYAWIDELAHRGERRRAVVVVSSYLPELFGICDRIAVMARGKLGRSRASDDIDEHDVMREATLGDGT